jgi:integrase
MAGVKITKRVVDGAEVREKRYTLFDSEVKGFGLRIYPSGQKTYVFEYRPGAGGRSETKKRATIGSATEFTPDEARKLADKLRASVKVGVDPQGDKAKARAAVSIENLTKDFLTEHVEAKRKANTIASYEQIINSHILPRLGKMKAKDVTGTHVAKLHFDMRATPSMANKTIAVISSMYSFAFKRGLVPKGENPAEDVEKYEETGVERLLSSLELERLGAAIRLAEAEGIPWKIDPTKKSKHLRKENRVTIIDPYAAAALRLLIFTGARLREILHLEWKHVDLERGLLLLPDSKTGKKTIVLNAPAMNVLSNLPRIGRYVIAGESAGTEDEKPRSDLKRPWYAVRRHAGLEDVRAHDFRHNFASWGVGGGMGLPIIGKLLGHKQMSTTQRYAHLDADPVRRAADEIGARITGAMSGGQKRKSSAVPLTEDDG